MTIAFRAVSNVGNASSATIVVPAPTGLTDGDLMVAFIACTGDTSVSTPTGWTLVNRTVAASIRTHATFWKIASSEGASWTWSLGAAVGNLGAVLAYTGATSITPRNASSVATTSTNTTSQDAPSVTSTVDNCMIVSGVFMNVATPPVTFTPPTGMTERVDAALGLNAIHLAVAEVLQPTAGASGTKTFTMGSSSGNSNVGHSIAIAPLVAAVDNVVKLVKGGSVVGDNKASATGWPTVDTEQSYGGAADLWGTTLTAADVNAADFGVVLSATVTEALAKVDKVTMTVYYSVPGQTDPAPFLAALHVDDTRTIATPWIYSLPRSGMTIANDPNVAKATSDASLWSSRYFRPQRTAQKTYDRCEFWLDIAPETNTPGFELWATVDEGTAFQLQDSAGVAVTFLTSGAHQAYFPRTSAAVGHYVQIEARVPALAGAEVACAVSFRDLTVFGSWRPLTTESIHATLILGPGEFDDRMSMRRTIQQQLADLEALVGPNAAPIAYQDIWGNTGYATVKALSFKEIVFKGQEQPTLVAQVELRKVYAP